MFYESDNLSNGFAGIKVYESNENQLVFELTLRWAGNPNIILAAKLLSAKVTVQVIKTSVS